MRSQAIFTLQLALLVAAAGTAKTGDGIPVYKCCGEFEMLSGDGGRCVQASWPENASIHRDNITGDVVPPLDAEWVRRWLPPGLRTQSIGMVKLNTHLITRFTEVAPNIVRANASMWNEHLLPEYAPEHVWRKQVIFHFSFIFRPKPGGGVREANYCVDAAKPPLGPFALVFKTICSLEECVRKCCRKGHVLVNEEGNSKCEKHAQGYWSPLNSSFTKTIDPEFPRREHIYCPRFRLAANEDRSAMWSRAREREQLFSTWLPCFDYYRNGNSIEEGLFYCEVPRIARGIYWTLQPLCVASVILLAVSLLAIACDKCMRRTIHGWCLASHAACLLGFNIGHAVYYILINKPVVIFTLPPFKQLFYLEKICTSIALPMYFLLTASWFWLTVLCVNVTLGFRLQIALPNSGGRKRFLVFSALAWGLPALLTITCYFLFIPGGHQWYNPSFMETRTCYGETPTPVGEDMTSNILVTIKTGTVLFYYGPIGSLMLVNIGCIVRALKNVQYLRRGNSVLRRDVEQTSQRHDNPARGIEGDNWSTADNRQGDHSRTAVDAKTIKLYIKMILMTGVIELVFEVIFWATTNTNRPAYLYSTDYHYPYRSSGYVTDFVRAACVAWLAAPKEGYFRPFLRRRCGDKR